MNTNNETKTNANVTTGTAGIPAGVNATSRPENQTPHVVPPLGGSSIGRSAIPQHILDFCHRIYPPHLGSAYDGERAHLIAKRMLIERELVGRPATAAIPGAPSSVRELTDSSTAPERAINSLQHPSIPSIESILSIGRAQSQAKQSRNEAGMDPEHTRNEAETEPEQTRNNSGTDPEQQPKQNTQTSANSTSEQENSQSNHRGNESKIDFLPPETREFVITVLASQSLDKAVNQLKRCSYPGASKLSRSCLHRYRHRLLREAARTRAAETKEFVEEIMGNPRTPDDKIAEAIRHIFHTRLLETINDPACALEDTLKAIQTSNRLCQK